MADDGRESSTNITSWNRGAPARWNRELGAWETSARGRAVLAHPSLYKGTAFTEDERRSLGLVGLIPHQELTLDQQATRAYAQYHSIPTNLAKNVWLRAVYDRNETLFYRLLTDHLQEMLPVVYTPTVGEAIQRYSHEYRRPRGVYLSVNAPEDIERSLLASGLGPDDLDLIVATDGEGILGIGDWGIGGMEISIGKLIVYTAAAGIAPSRTMPVILDVGTNRESLLEDPLYLGNRHPRVDQETYDAFIDAYVETARRLFPNALLHWEDFGASNARRVLDRHRDSMPTFNDDMQGTGAIILAAILTGVRYSGLPLADHRFVVLGAGTAGVGIADQFRDALVSAGVPKAEADKRVWLVGRHGLITEETRPLRPFQVPYARPVSELDGWEVDPQLGGVPLLEVIRQAKPTILIGTSGQPGVFNEAVVKAMAAGTERPIIMPLSNPTDLAEAQPVDLIEWTQGRALVATGSPFDPVKYGDREYLIAQANNALVFPGLGVGTIVAKARVITDGMLRAAADAVSELVDLESGSLLPQVRDLRATSNAVAAAVIKAAVDEGVAPAIDLDTVDQLIADATWDPVYAPVLAV